MVNFDNQSQIKLMQKWLEKMPWLKLTYGILLLMVFIFLMLLLFIFKPWQVKKYAREDQIYLQLQAHFTKQGYKRQSGQLVSEYCAHLSHQFSLPLNLCEHFSQKYNQIKYQPNQSTKAYQKRLKQLIHISKQLKKQSKITPNV
ncbi:hypothetical protein ACLKMH_13485 [Psychromonas sp. KJ10-10]|uniref:hypothetical protein n=1 Tax=Psychromonas sp. KJ10-10 TaxID=3391823 RepID=UPI0039B37E05